ncbi:hypothetical protein E1301_Tti023597 [Triplophysa tibetana]|uniref:SEA domain-containing protein n=1 Tax=Triplophysa tibetana TaxID=1572043 RepID=A0A5A9PJT6_9TELE|nr:hypothetical protein E1301_Tti023597 [Triplophysa tibetana]
MELTTTKVPPHASVFPVTSVPETSGLAEVTSKLVFDSSPVPSKDLVLRAVNSLRNSRESKLDKSVELKNVSYEKISDTSYAVIFKFSLTNVSMSDPVKEVLNITNTALNTLLNEPEIPFDAALTNFTKNGKQIEVHMERVFNDAYKIKPVSFLNELRSQNPSENKLIEGKAVIRIRILVETLRPIRTEKEILEVTPLLDERFRIKQKGRMEKPGEPVSFKDVSFHYVSDNSYALDFGFEIYNLSMAEKEGDRNSSLIQDAINKLLNEILHENPSADKIDFDVANFTTGLAEVTADVVYSVSKSKIKAPSKFLLELFKDTTPNRLGTAIIVIRLVFITRGPIPTESAVLQAANKLLDSRIRTKREVPKLNEPVSNVNVTYTKLSNNSYALDFGFEISDVNMSEKIVLRDSTHILVQDSINKLLSIILNDKAAPLPTFVLPKTNFTGNDTVIMAAVEYVFKDDDIKAPSPFLEELLNVNNGLTPTTVPPQATRFPVTSVPEIKGKAVIRIRILVETLGPIPSEKEFLGLISLLDSRFTTNQKGRSEKLGEPVSFQNVTFQKISDNSYALDFGFEINNVSMAENQGNRNSTYKFIQDAINKLLNEILHENPSADKINFDDANFTNGIAEVTARVVYNVSKSNIMAPSKFLLKLFEDNTPYRLGKVIIVIKLVFNTRGPVPTESAVLKIANSLLDSRLRTKRQVTKLNDPVSNVNVTYTKISDNSYALNFGFEIINVNMSERLVLRNSTYILIQDSINKLLNQILNDPNATPFVFERANFTGDNGVIKADVVYIFKEDDFKFPSPFIFELTYVNTGTTTAAPTTTFFPSSTSPTWIVAIIVPCAIAIMLIPCWILLCCLLCGCCARLRQRWHRRRSYNVQYTTRNSIF